MATAPKTTATRQFAGLVFAKVEASQLETLRQLLSVVGHETIETMHGRPPENPIVPFKKLASVHYARFVLVDAYDELEPHLAFATDYDGPEGDSTCSESEALDSHLDELVAECGQGLERIFECCENYRKGKLKKFLKGNRIRASTFYVGSTGRSVNQVLWEAELRRNVDAILDQGAWREAPPERVRESVLTELAEKYPGLSVGEKVELPEFPAQPNLMGKVHELVAKAALLLFSILAAAMVLAWRLLEGTITTPWLHRTVAGFAGLLAVAAIALVLYRRFRHLEKTDLQFQPKYDEDTHDQFRVASADENRFLQNQLTHLVRVKPGLLRALVIRGVFFALQVLATNQYNKGKLGGIPSIHFARWVLIPNGGVLFFSNFDSSWQSYLGDFIDQASSGLTAVWSNTKGYPRTTNLLKAGSRDASRFLAWTRHHQIPSQVWYAAYPGLSIVNVNANTEIHRGLTKKGRNEIDASTWLFRLRAVDRRFADELYSTREEQLDLENIQGIILRGYGHMPFARFLMFRMRPGEDRSELRKWLSALPVTSAAVGAKSAVAQEYLLNVAFTYQGLRLLGLDERLCASFSTPFVQGSDDEFRARVNGDVGENSPRFWEWGSPEHPVHVLLMVYAKTAAKLEQHVVRYEAEGKLRGLELVKGLDGVELPGRKEHFGFRDGIAQPVVKGCGDAEPPGNSINAGEILLGHLDGYRNVAHSPVSPCGFAFGHDGSYLVFRQLEQDVGAFWRYCAPEDRSDDAAIEVASKMVGRWPSGASLVRHPDKDPEKARYDDEDDFGYLTGGSENDRYGARCPFGAHIRRVNPRDWQLGENQKESQTLSNLHRIVRRGRPYGAPLVESMAARELIRAARASNGGTTGVRRGLQFLCFNASLERQFEFIQQQWCNNPKFAGLNSDADPLLGSSRTSAELGIDPASFSVQSDVKSGLAARCTHMQNFVHVRGSAYFFMPSLSAIRLLHDGIRTVPAKALLLEKPPPDEQVHIDSLIESLREKMKRDYVGGRTLRDAHPKMHGLVKAKFIVEPDLDPSLSVGLFATPRELEAWVRFSNQEGTVSEDSKPDIRGVAIKLLNVPGRKLLDGEEECTTHDFVMISHDAFVTKDVAEFDELIKAVVKNKVPRFLLSHWRVAWNLLRSLKKHSSPLEIQYFSVAPYLWGESAVKYTLKPSSDMKTPIPDDPSPRYLRNALVSRLRKESVSFDFMVQLRENEKQMPIEDPGVPWHSEFRKVATLELRREDCDEPRRWLYGDNLSFNPWRCLPEHRPLGGISRARRQVYRALSSFRHDRNSEPRVEPTSLDVPTDSLRAAALRKLEDSGAAPVSGE